MQTKFLRVVPVQVLSGAVVFFALLATSNLAQAQLRIVQYNAGDVKTDTHTVLQMIGLEEVNGIAKPIDVICIQEQDNSGSVAAMASVLNGIYGAGTYAAAPYVGTTSGGGLPGMVYRVGSVSLIDNNPSPSINDSAVGIGTVDGTHNARQTIRYRLRPVGYTSSADFYIYNSHFKASSGSTNAARRDAEATSNRADADALGEGTSIIYMGDYNLYSGNEAAYTTMTADAGAGKAVDYLRTLGANSIPLVWGVDSNLTRKWHTQSPATVEAYPGQVLSGMDDRFDFQLFTDELNDNEGMSIIPGSYRSFGNDGTHNFGGAINVSNEWTPTGLTSGQITSTLNALTTASDHIPVVVDYQIPARMTVSTATASARVMKNSAATASITVSNSASVVAVAGADELDYSVSGSGDVTGSVGSATDNALGSGNTHNIALSTSTTGLKSGSINVTATSPGVPTSDTPQGRSVNYTVVDNRTVSASSVSFGSVIVGSAVNGTTNLSTSGDDDHFTHVTVQGTAVGADGNGVSVSAGSAVLFNSNASAGSRSLSATFSSAGSKSGSRPLSVQGEGLSGEIPVAVNVPYSATALDHANASFANPADQNTITIDFGTIVAGSGISSSAFSVYNLLATMGFTANLDIDSIGGTGDTSKLYTNFVSASVAPNTSHGYLAYLDASSLIPGAFSAAWTIGTSDQDLPGATAFGSQQILVNMLANVVAGGPANLIWKGPTNNIWNINSTANWNSGPAVVYHDGDNVTFDETGANTIPVNITAAVSPGSVTVNNTSTAYKFTGSAITGSTGLAKQGSGSLTLANSNSYTGNTVIDAGSVVVEANNALGSGASSTQLGAINGLANASLLVNGPFTVDRNVTVRSGSSGTLTLGDVNTTGTATYSGNVTLNNAVTLTAAGTSTVVFNGDLDNSSGSTITKTGAGTVDLAVDATHGVGAKLAVQQGTALVHLTPAANPLGSNLWVDVSSSANVVLAANSTRNAVVGKLTIDGGATPTGTVDITNNSLIIDYSGASPFSTIQAQIVSAYLFGSWAGQGITSSDVAANPSVNAIGYAENFDLGLANYSDPQSGSDPVDFDTIVVKFTYGGDADLDGDVDGDDYLQLLGNIFSGNTWFQGDFDYDGDVDGDDYLVLSGNIFNSGLGGVTGLGGGITPVPEPTSCVLLFSGSIIGVGLLCLKRAGAREAKSTT